MKSHIKVLILNKTEAFVWGGGRYFCWRSRFGPQAATCLPLSDISCVSLLLSLSLCKCYLCQDLSSWSSADELDTSGSLSPLSGRSTPSRRRSVTYTSTCTCCSMRSQVFSYPSETVHTAPCAPNAPLKAIFTTAIPISLLSSTPFYTSTTCSTLPPSEFWTFSSLLLFLHVPEQIPARELGNSFFLTFYFLFLFLGWLFQFCPSCHLLSFSFSTLKQLLSYKTFFPPIDFPLTSTHSSFRVIPVVLFLGILAIMKLLNVQKEHRNCGFMM